METIANIPSLEHKKRIIIIGGGFAGLQLSEQVSEKYFQVVLLDKVNYYQFQPLMYQVATGGLEPSSIAYPHRKRFQKHKDFHFRMCEAQEVVPDLKVVRTSIGELSYDYLVIATGCGTNYFGNDSLKESTFGLKSISESLLIRNRILLSLEEAMNSNSPQREKECLTFVIVGGGATGVELAGALLDMKRSVLPKDYPKLDLQKMEIHLVDGASRLLSAMSEKASRVVERTLLKRGIILHQNVTVKNYDAPPTVVMSNGETLCSQNVFWVAGIKPNGLAGLQEEAYMRGRVVVDAYNTVLGNACIYCIGDTSILVDEEHPRGHPQVAQVAMQMASNLAGNLNKIVTGKSELKPFKYYDKGSLATIGRNAAVADLNKMHFSGIIAWWLWLWVHILTIVGMKNKIMVFLDWMWSYLRYDVSLRLLIKPTKSNIYKE